MDNSARLNLQNITKRFGSNVALNNVSFEIRKGEVHSLVGENGAGKSTLMRILAGIYTEFEGQYQKDNKDARPENPKHALSMGIGMIHQELSVIPQLSVAENLLLGNLPKTLWGAIDWKSTNFKAKALLASVGFANIGVSLPLERFPLGFQQIIEILRVVNSGADILIMDEPTSALSPNEVSTLMTLIADLKAKGRSIIYISHFIEEVLQVSDRVTVLRDGDHIATLDRDETDVAHLISLILGHSAKHALPDIKQSPDTNICLKTSGLTSDTYSDINLSIHNGEVVGLFGAVGAGHFDVAKTLFGVYTYDAGEISISDIAFKKGFSSTAAVSAGIAYATESRRLGMFLEDEIYKNITLPHLGEICGLMPDQSIEMAASKTVIEQTNVQPPNPLQLVGKLSGGNQQKVAISRWLTVPPKLLIVSEPTRGMDVGAKNDVLSILRELRNSGIAVLVVSSEPETVLAVSDRILTMARGKLTGELQHEDFKQEKLMRLVST